MARKSRKQTAAPMPAPSLYVHVALYIRLSVEDNKKRGCSVENQKLVLNDFLSDKPDFVVYDTYIDNGATGTNFHRPGFQQMLSDIEAGHINCVIVKDLSRLGRNSIDTGYYIEQYFHAHNVRFIAVTDQFDTADSGNLHGGIMLPLKNMINEAYALDIGRKIKAQARQAMKDGDYIGARAPYGYRKDPDDCHKLLIDENTAPVVKQIFEWAHEHVALNRIVRNLNEMGIPAPSHYKKTTGEITSPGLIGSGKWQTRTVMKILESEVYTGDLVQGKTKIVDNQPFGGFFAAHKLEKALLQAVEGVLQREIKHGVRLYFAPPHRLALRDLQAQPQGQPAFACLAGAGKQRQTGWKQIGNDPLDRRQRRGEEFFGGDRFWKFFIIHSHRPFCFGIYLLSHTIVVLCVVSFILQC